MEPNSEAHALIQSARSTNNIAVGLSAVGGGLIGWPIGSAIGGGDPQWILAGIGAGVILIAIPISISANKKSLKAFDLFNAGLTYQPPESPTSQWHLVSNGSGIGLSWQF